MFHICLEKVVRYACMCNASGHRANSPTRRLARLSRVVPHIGLHVQQTNQPVYIFTENLHEACVYRCASDVATSNINLSSSNNIWIGSSSSTAAIPPLAIAMFHRFVDQSISCLIHLMTKGQVDCVRGQMNSQTSMLMHCRPASTKSPDIIHNTTPT